MFLMKGAEVVIGWNAPVTIDHTGATTLTSPEHYVKETMTFKSYGTDSKEIR